MWYANSWEVWTHLYLNVLISFSLMMSTCLFFPECICGAGFGAEKFAITYSELLLFSSPVDVPTEHLLTDSIYGPMHYWFLGCPPGPKHLQYLLIAHLMKCDSLGWQFRLSVIWFHPVCPPQFPSPRKSPAPPSTSLPAPCVSFLL